MVELVDISKASLVASGDYLDQILTYLELLTTFGLGMETITTPWLIAIPTTGTKQPPFNVKFTIVKLIGWSATVALSVAQASHTMIREVNLTLPSYHLHGVFNTMNYDLDSVALLKLPAHSQPSGIESGISASVKASYCLTTCSIG